MNNLKVGSLYASENGCVYKMLMNLTREFVVMQPVSETGDRKVILKNPGLLNGKLTWEEEFDNRMN